MATPNAIAVASASYTGLAGAQYRAAELYLLNQWRIARGGSVQSLVALADASKCFSCLDKKQGDAAETYILSVTT